MFKPTGYIKLRSVLLKCLCLSIGAFILLPGFSQVKLIIHLNKLPASHIGDTIFVAGNFNNWNSGDTNYRFFLHGNIRSIELKALTAGTYEFKFTRGNWGKVESAFDGKTISNHTINLTRDTTLSFSIAGWGDDFASIPKTHTASAHVRVLDTAFEMPQLKRHRRVWLYLPQGYGKTKKRYPVIYMQDGQNIFDEYTAAYGEWGVDESMDSLIAKGRPACIVVGIDNGGDTRMNEYNPYEFTLKDSANSKMFLPEGDQYLEFLSKTLKPYIDKHYRTLSSKENTIIAGSSMGGLISYYALLKYPEIFGNAGIFSPAFWTANGIDKLTDSLAGNLDAKLFFYIGDGEGKENVDRMNAIIEKIAKKSPAMVCSVIDPDGEHNEQAWRKWFVEFYKWITADGFNVITSSRN